VGGRGDEDGTEGRECQTEGVKRNEGEFHKKRRKPSGAARREASRFSWMVRDATTAGGGPTPDLYRAAAVAADDGPGLGRS
jgi:hypothetical protein